MDNSQAETEARATKTPIDRSGNSKNNKNNNNNNNKKRVGSIRDLRVGKILRRNAAPSLDPFLLSKEYKALINYRNKHGNIALMSSKPHALDPLPKGNILRNIKYEGLGLFEPPKNAKQGFLYLNEANEISIHFWNRIMDDIHVTIKRRNANDIVKKYKGKNIQEIKDMIYGEEKDKAMGVINGDILTLAKECRDINSYNVELVMWNKKRSYEERRWMNYEDRYFKALQMVTDSDDDQITDEEINESDRVDVMKPEVVEEMYSGNCNNEEEMYIEEKEKEKMNEEEKEMKRKLRLLKLPKRPDLGKVNYFKCFVPPKKPEFRLPCSLEEAKKICCLLCELTKKEPIYVNSIELLDELVKKMESEVIISFDLEHSMVSSFPATSLIQITTGSDLRDYIIDPFPIWNNIYKLRDAFADPHILKIGHNVTCDSQWLWRDFKIPIVSLYDTGVPYYSVTNIDITGYQKLLDVMLSFSVSKEQQKSHWERRPLKDEQIRYAANDSHFLFLLARSEMEFMEENGITFPPVPKHSTYPFEPIALTHIQKMMMNVVRSNQLNLVTREGKGRRRNEGGGGRGGNRDDKKDNNNNNDNNSNPKKQTKK